MAALAYGERVRQLELTLKELNVSVGFLQTQASGFAQVQEEFRLTLATVDKENAALKQSIGEQTRRHDDHVRRAEVWGQRWWALMAGLVLATVGAIFSLAVALARK